MPLSCFEKNDRRWDLGCLGPGEDLARGLNIGDLAQEQFDQLDLTQDLGLQLVRKRTTVPCASRVEQLPAVLMQWIEAGDALSGEQTLDAVRVPDPLLQQYRALAAYPPTVFLFRRGRHNHRTDTRFSA